MFIYCFIAFDPNFRSFRGTNLNENRYIGAFNLADHSAPLEAFKCWAEFLTTKTKNPGKYRWCNVESNFVLVAGEKHKKRKAHKRSREEWLEQLESVSNRARTDNAENEPESGERESRRVPFPGIGT